MAEKAYRKPLPRIDEESRGFWEALARHELYFQRCRSCGTQRFYPRAVCPVCLSDAVEWVRASGRGTVYSFVVYHHPPVPYLEMPYVVALIELEEGTRLVSNVVGVAPSQKKAVSGLIAGRGRRAGFFGASFAAAVAPGGRNFR